MKEKRALIVGTLAFDKLFSVDPSISSETQRIKIDEEAIRKKEQFVNLNFVASAVKTSRGGTAGNIAYTLGLLGKKPVVFSVAGEDFRTSGYEAVLKNLGVEIAVECFDGEQTACCYQISDEHDNQMTIWQSNAYDHVDEISLNENVKAVVKDIQYAIFSTGSPVGTLKHMEELRSLNDGVKIIFDPGQRVVSYDRKKFQKGLESCDILAVNTVELQKIIDLGFSERELLRDYAETIIETLGARGSRIKTASSTTEIGTAKPIRVTETTGAGDAYRGGLLAGLLEGKDVIESARMGTVVASYCVEGTGPQSHRINREDVDSRLSQVTFTRFTGSPA